MKKILAIILVLMLAFSTLLITACNKENTADLEPETSSTQETTSTRQRGDAAGSGTTTPTSVGDTTTSTSDDNTTSSDDEPGSSSSQTPSQDGEHKYGSYDYTYQNAVTMPSEMVSEAGKFDMLICLFAEDFTKPQLTDAFYSALVDYEDRYNKLSAVDKGAVKNYPFLQEARKAYNDMAKQECEKLISTLPDASTENIDEFSALAKAIEKLINNLGSEANSIPNKATYDNKVAQIDTIYINSFNQKVAEVKTFEYTPAYKAKLDNAMAFYNELSASQKSAVNTSYTELTDLILKYDDTGVVNAFNEVYSKLPAPSAVVKEDKTNIELARTMFNKMSNTQLLLLGNNEAIRNNLNSLKAAIDVLCPIFYWAGSIDGTNSRTKTMSFDNISATFDFAGLSSATGSFPLPYDGKILQKAFSCNANASFKVNVPYGGKLVIYAMDYNNKGINVNVTVSGGSHSETKQLVANNTTEFYIPAGGDYTVTFSEKVKIFAVEFS